ncbi:hypothetical protein EW145_g3651 [Phellinidium pouzarii]|uniref:Uncharacterized protein n=1 Tax=Phellinidium pouzarii TaxID=167371 RepID=A0A4S4LBJ9_9AGAM|nr:hypothetical protein EW145_g3651 [Phellinidium pouzarii]
MRNRSTSVCSISSADFLPSENKEPELKAHEEAFRKKSGSWYESAKPHRETHKKVDPQPAESPVHRPKDDASRTAPQTDQTSVPKRSQRRRQPSSTDTSHTGHSGEKRPGQATPVKSGIKSIYENLASKFGNGSPVRAASGSSSNVPDASARAQANGYIITQFQADWDAQAQEGAEADAAWTRICQCLSTDPAYEAPVDYKGYDMVRKALRQTNPTASLRRQIDDYRKAIEHRMEREERKRKGEELAKERRRNKYRERDRKRKGLSEKGQSEKGLFEQRAQFEQENQERRKREQEKRRPSDPEAFFRANFEADGLYNSYGQSTANCPVYSYSPGSVHIDFHCFFCYCHYHFSTCFTDDFHNPAVCGDIRPDHRRYAGSSSNPAPADPLRGVFARYEYLWTLLSSPQTVTADLNFSRIPWPLLEIPRSSADVTADKIKAFLFHERRTVVTGAMAKDSKRLIRDELRRWHPDKFAVRVLGRISDVGERERVREAAETISKVMTSLI